MTIPYHPMIVHIPIAFAIFTPFIGIALFYLIYKGRLPLRAWGAVAIWQLLLAGAVYAALVSGEWEEEKVEAILAEEEPLERHEESAENFFYLSLIALLLALPGLRPGAVGSISRSATLLLQLILLGFCIWTARLGGELVYLHGAAKAYTSDKAPPLMKGAGDKDDNGREKEYKEER